MPKRIYSDAYVDRQIAKVDAMFEKNMSHIIVTPECMMPRGHHAYIRDKGLLPHELKEVRAYNKQLQELSFVQGFWTGWTLRDGTKDPA